MNLNSFFEAIEKKNSNIEVTTTKVKVPAGTYEAKIAKISSGANANGTAYLKVDYKITSGEFANSTMSSNLYLTEASQYFFEKGIVDLLQAVNTTVDFNTEDKDEDLPPKEFTEKFSKILQPLCGEICAVTKTIQETGRPQYSVAKLNEGEKTTC